jgi:hypothetical protein
MEDGSSCGRIADFEVKRKFMFNKAPDDEPWEGCCAYHVDEKHLLTDKNFFVRRIYEDGL